MKFCRTQMKLIRPILVFFCLAILAPVFGQNPGQKTEETPEWWERPVRMLRVDHMPDFAEMKNEDMDALARSRVEKWGINCEWIMGALAWGGRDIQNVSPYQNFNGAEAFFLFA